MAWGGVEDVGTRADPCYPPVFAATLVGPATVPGVAVAAVRGFPSYAED